MQYTGSKGLLEARTTQPEHPARKVATPEQENPPVEVPLDELVHLLRRSLGPEQGEAELGSSLAISSQPAPVVRGEAKDDDAPHQHGERLSSVVLQPSRRCREPSLQPRLFSHEPAPDSYLPPPPRLPTVMDTSLLARAVMSWPPPAIGRYHWQPTRVAAALAAAAVAATLAAVYVLF